MIPLIQLEVVDSTQSFLMRHPELGFCAVMADAQTDGRGRHGNRWESERGAGLFLSVRMPAPARAPGVLLQNAMMDVAQELLPCGVRLGLKWPNDLVAYRQGLLVKVGGILGEMKGNVLTLGLGVNLGCSPKIDGRLIPPSCLKDLGSPFIPDAPTLARGLLNRWCHLESDEGRCRSKIDVLAFRWPEVGQWIAWNGDSGCCKGWESDGRLAVETSRGLQKLSSEDIWGLSGTTPITL